MPNSHRRFHGRRLFKADDLVDAVRDGSNKIHEREAVIHTVYKTMAPTFEGEVAGYTTVGKSDEKPTPVRKEEPESTPKANPKTTTTAAPKKQVTTTSPKPTPTTSKKSDDDDKDKDKAQSKTTTTSEKTSSVPSAIRVPTDSASLGSVLATASEERVLPTTLVRPTEAPSSIALADATATPEATASKSEGSSPGAKAGIAFGVLGGLFLVGLLVFLAFNRRRKRAEHQKLARDDEKLNGPIGGGFAPIGGDDRAVAADNMSVKTDPKAPRISLRPVTQFLPTWGEEKNANKGAGIALTTPVATQNPVTTSRAPGGSAWDRPTTSQSIDPANPFGAQAERVPSPIQEETTSLHNSPPSPLSDKTPVSAPTPADGPPVAAAAAVGAAAGAGAAAGLTRKASMRKDGPKELDLTLPTITLDPVPASPAGTEFSVSSVNPSTPAAAAPSAGAAAIAAAGGPPNSAVHRVQLDFKPTLEDELELRAGDLVRLLHEYDDGWALCIRLDRSRQGVAPRTCLSTRPVKPRPAQNGPPRPGPPVKPAGPPQGPPRGPQPGQRPMTPQGRPMTPNGGRPQSPMGRPMSPAGRPGMRPQSPGPRSQSPAPRPGPPGGRSMSPAPRSQSPGPRSQSPGPRSQSPGPRNGPGGRNSPPGPSPMNPAQAPRPGPSTGSVNRKPVPGQAY